MSSYSQNHKPGNNNSDSSYNGSSVDVHGKWDSPTFQRQNVRVNWTAEEQTALQEALAKYVSQPNAICYAKIAVQLKNKSVRDVAMRCRWMTNKEIGKRRKEDINPRKGKNRKVHPSNDCDGFF